MPEAGPLLLLDTTTSTLMIGVWREGQIISRFAQSATSQRYHSAILIPSIQRCLEEAGLKPTDLQALAINSGPGSFTGVRTGISTARTMGQALDLPVYVINRFEMLVYDSRMQGHPGPVAVCLDALRGQAYTAVLDFTDDGPVYRQVPALQPVGGLAFGKAATVRVAPSLQPVLEGTPIDDNLWTPAVMAALVERFGALYRCRWPEVKPLYLQEANITLRKADKTSIPR